MLEKPIKCMKTKSIIPLYSINFDKTARSPKEIIYLIYHYTGMKSEKKAIDRLMNKNSKVSCHYFIKRNGTIINMVPDKYIAWHAGVSCWKNHRNLNNKSIGIEIQNSGHLNTYQRFSIKQIRSLVLLTKILKKKYNIKSKNFLGHSDIAPNRKVDPGEKFPWQYLAKHKIGIWHNFIKKDSTFKGAEVSKKDQWLFYMYLRKMGYCCKGKQAKYMKFIIKAFQRRYRPKKINGKIDQESLVIAKNLVKRGLN